MYHVVLCFRSSLTDARAVEFEEWFTQEYGSHGHDDSLELSGKWSSVLEKMKEEHLADLVVWDGMIAEEEEQGQGAPGRRSRLPMPVDAILEDVVGMASRMRRKGFVSKLKKKVESIEFVVKNKLRLFDAERAGRVFRNEMDVCSASDLAEWADFLRDVPFLQSEHEMGLTFGDAVRCALFAVDVGGGAKAQPVLDRNEESDDGPVEEAAEAPRRGTRVGDGQLEGERDVDQAGPRAFGRLPTRLQNPTRSEEGF